MKIDDGYFCREIKDFKVKGFNKKAEVFPAGYIRYAEHFKLGVTLYCWEFVKPGETMGYPIQAMTYVNGRWVLFLKALRLAEETPK